MKKIDYMGRRRDKYRERAVGVQYGVGSDEEDELLSDDDDATGKKLIHCVSNAKISNTEVEEQNRSQDTCLSRSGPASATSVRRLPSMTMVQQNSKT